MKCKNAASAKAVFGFFNTIFFVCGFIEVVCGFLLLCDTQRVLLSRLLAAPDSGLNQPPFYYLALALLAAGLAMCATSALGCWATYVPGYIILTIYFLIVLALLLCECAGGVVAAVWPRCVGLQSAAGGAVGALQTYYAVPDYEQFTAAVDLAQTELECCGITDARNYDMSVWQLRRLGPRGMAVPPSCCVQRVEDSSYLNPAPVNQSRCQEVKPDPAFRYVPVSDTCQCGSWWMAVPPSCCVQRVEDASYLNPAPVNQSRCQEVKPDPAFRYVPVSDTCQCGSCGGSGRAGWRCRRAAACREWKTPPISTPRPSTSHAARRSSLTPRLDTSR
ncbi:tetraspanin family domain-containing protein [Phthorimaea operculella]|nr:tetraspanin family domain-containing protein [Phthorimaea operculella]